MTAQLPDPRRYAPQTQSALTEAAERTVAVQAAHGRSGRNELGREIGALLERGEEAAVRDALNNPASALACRALYDALDAALSPGKTNSAVSLQVFAIPVLFVVGAPSAQRVTGVIGDVDAIRSLFGKSGALGHCRNFGVSNALATLESVEAIAWTTLHSIANAQRWDDYAQFDLPPADIDVAANVETVHLRFISGAALTPSDAPAFAEAAGDIGRWGMQFTKEFARQLATPDVSLLAIPRPPRSIVRAAREGWFAARELGFQLFLSNALRQARMRAGEPDITISSGSDQTIRIRLTSPFDESFEQIYGWPLAPSDDFREIASSIFSLLEEARVERFQVIPEVEDIADVRQATH